MDFLALIVTGRTWAFSVFGRSEECFFTPDMSFPIVLV